MTWYLRVRGMTEPYDSGLDVSNSVMMFEIQALCRPTEELLEELMTVLEEELVGTRGVNIFATTNVAANRPDTHLVLKSHGGFDDLNTQGTTPPSYIRPIVQVMAVSTSPTDAKDLAWQAYHAFETIRNRHIVA